MWGARGLSEDRRGTAPRARALVYIAYAHPALPLVALALPLYVIVPTFYSESIGLSVAAVGTVLLTIRLFDAATDPVFAWLADRWRGRGGRRRGFFLASLPLTAGSAFMLFWSPVEAGLGCLAFWAALVSIGFTWTPLPYTAWGAELSGDYSERTRNSAFREGATLIGILLATSLPFSIGLTEREGMRGLQAMAILLAILLPISGLAAVALVPEPKNRSSRELGLFEGAAFMAANRPFLRLIAAFLLNGFAKASGHPVPLFRIRPAGCAGLARAAASRLFRLRGARRPAGGEGRQPLRQAPRMVRRDVGDLSDLRLVGFSRPRRRERVRRHLLADRPFARFRPGPSAIYPGRRDRSRHRSLRRAALRPLFCGMEPCNEAVARSRGRAGLSCSLCRRRLREFVGRDCSAVFLAADRPEARGDLADARFPLDRVAQAELLRRIGKDR